MGVPVTAHRWTAWRAQPGSPAEVAPGPYGRSVCILIRFCDEARAERCVMYMAARRGVLRDAPQGAGGLGTQHAAGETGSGGMKAHRQA